MFQVLEFVCLHGASRVLVYSLTENSGVGAPPVFPRPGPEFSRGSLEHRGQVPEQSSLLYNCEVASEPRSDTVHPRLVEEDGHVSPLEGLCALGVKRFSEAFLVKDVNFLGTSPRGVMIPC